MNSYWENIGEKVFSLYKNMEYRTDESSEYTVEQFEADLEIEKTKKLAPELLNEEFDSEEALDLSQCISRFRKVIDGRRSILKKLFSLGNYLNGFDTLIEYCDYYGVSYNVKYEEDVGIYDPFSIFSVIFKYIGENKKIMEKELCKKVWNLLLNDIGPMKFDILPLDLVLSGSTAILIMADSDLSAAVNALIKWQDSFLRVSHILVQEPIREKFVDTIPDHDIRKWVIDNLFVFRNIGEVIGYLNSSKNLLALSVWSENIISAKNFAADLEIDTIWINTHGDLSPGLSSISYYNTCSDNIYIWESGLQKKSDYSSKNIRNSLTTVDLFHGGKWEVPIEGKYWTDKSGVSFAQATKKDLDKCIVAARKAFKIWRSTKLSHRIKVVKFFAERVRAHGESEYADKILQFANPQLLDLGNTLSIVRDGEAEITTTLKPIGVILLCSDNQEDLFKKLAISVLTGNTVIIVIENEQEVTFSPFCDMLAGSGFPPGVINCLFADKDYTIKLFNESNNVDRVLGRYFPDDDHPFSRKLLFFTKPKSLWLQRS